MRALALSLTIAAAMLISPAVQAAKKPPAARGGPIAVVLNGERLRLDPPPRFVRLQLLVPVRHIISALGLDFQRQGSRIVTHAGYKTVTLTIGNRRADVDGEPVAMETAPAEIKNILYAPLRFFTAALGAQAAYDRRTNTVTIVAQLVGRTGQGIIEHGNQVEQMGTVAAVDVNSNPPTITIQHNASVRTIRVSPNAAIELQDVNVNVSVPGELSDIRPGDTAHIFSSKRGSADRIVDAFGSRAGAVAAVAEGQVVLEDGHVITAGRTTQVSINGAAATIGNVRGGDQVTVRYNVDSGEVRELLVSRAPSGGLQAAGGLTVDEVGISSARPLRAGQLLTVTARGTPSAAATFDLGSFVKNLAMRETSSGNYVGNYRIPAGANFAGVPAVVHLQAQGQHAQAQSDATVAASSVPPGVSDVAPANGAVVNSDHPAIYASFVAGVVPVNASSVVLWVNGHDVTSSSVRTARFIEYAPSLSYPNGLVRVTVRLGDLAGNTTTKSWSFSIRR
jgi:copper amine oxidase-like protein